jgi:hypothetical protein
VYIKIEFQPNLEHKNLYEAFYFYKPIVNHLRIFGSKEFSRIPKEDRRKLDAKSIKCVFIDYCADHKSYKMYDPITDKFFASRDVIFHEYVDEVQKEDDKDAWKLSKEGIESAKEKEIEDKQDDVEYQSSIEATIKQSTPRNSGATTQSSEALQISTRQIQTSIKYKYYVLMAQVMSVEENLKFE